MASGILSDEEDTSAAAEVGHTQPLLLLLDAKLHCMPWESMPSLRLAQVYRMPCLLLACSAARMQAGSHQHTQPTSGSDVHTNPSGPVNVMSDVGTSRPFVEHEQPTSTGPDLPTEQHHKPKGEVHTIDMSNTFYLLNPAGDLVDTQRTFEGRFTEEFRWQVSVS